MGPGQDHRRRPRSVARAGLQRLTSRLVEVSPERLVGWVERYAATHPDPVASLVDTAVRLDVAGGGSATLSPLLPFRPDPAPGDSDLVAALARHAAEPNVTALILIRRGVAAMGVARHLDVPDPRSVVLRAAAARAQCLVVTVRGP